MTKSSQHLTYLFIHSKHTFSIAMTHLLSGTCQKLPCSFGACVVNFSVCWPKIIFRFCSIIKSEFRLTEKPSTYSTEGSNDQKFPTFNLPIYPFKTYIFYCYDTFIVRNLPETTMYKVLRLPIAKVHNVSQGPVWKFIFIWSMSMFAVWICQIFIHI